MNITLKSELIDGRGKPSIACMLRVREKLQTGSLQMDAIKATDGQMAKKMTYSRFAANPFSREGYRGRKEKFEIKTAEICEGVVDR